MGVLSKAKQESCFCAFCKSPKKIYSQRHVSTFDLLGIGMGSVAVSFVIWRAIVPQLIVFFVIFAMIAEVFIQMRWRMRLICTDCGFDPIVYSKNPSEAARIVRQKLEERKNDPNRLLARRLNLPKISAKRSDELKNPPQVARHISKQI